MIESRRRRFQQHQASLAQQGHRQGLSIEANDAKQSFQQRDVVVIVVVVIIAVGDVFVCIAYV